MSKVLNEKGQAQPQEEEKKENGLALTSDAIFRAMEKAVPEGATTIHVLEGAATLIGASLVQMKATKQDLRAVLHHIEDYVNKKVKLESGNAKAN